LSEVEEDDSLDQDRVASPPTPPASMDVTQRRLRDDAVAPKEAVEISESALPDEDEGRESDADEDCEDCEDSSSSSRGSRVGTLVAQRYRVGRLLGEGSMGAVYEAEHIHMKKRFALKVLHRSMSEDPQVVARFEREAVAAGRLSHPGVVAATDFGRLPDESFYLALEFVDGRPLTQVLEECVVFSPERAFRVAFQVNSVLEAAHAEGIVHRDLKPDNIMVVRTDDSEDFVKVLDFGIAKMRFEEEGEERITQAGLVFGTPEYMSPEQARGHEVDSRSDLYGVGMLLYEMLAGQSPFFGDDLMQMLTAQITAPAPELPPEVPKPLRLLVARLLEKDPASRPQSASELDRELRSIAQELEWMLPTPRTNTGSRMDAPVSLAEIQKAERPSFAFKALSSVQSLSNHPVAFGRKKVPLWVPAASLIGGISLGAYLALTALTPPAEKEAVVQGPSIDVEERLLDEARSGDREAVSELRRLATERGKNRDSHLLPEESSPRVASRFLALGRGYSVIKHHSAAIEMYREAVRLDAHLAQDTELLLDVRVAMAARDAVDDGLQFALSTLGAHGADLIYDVYLDHVGQPGKTSVVARAMKLVKSSELLEQATPELRVALRLENAKFCHEYRDSIPSAVRDADDRSLPKLRSLLNRRGCGTDRNEDCFVCLRRDEGSLERAIETAASRSAPTFVRAPSPGVEED
jgi:serine/threonine protein kinase